MWIWDHLYFLPFLSPSLLSPLSQPQLLFLQDFGEGGWFVLIQSLKMSSPQAWEEKAFPLPCTFVLSVMIAVLAVPAESGLGTFCC